jgi:chromosome segregation ATPase
MAKAVVTPEQVAEVATSLIAAGQEPTLLIVQERTGGSYTTVKRHLELWRARQQHQAAEQIVVPPEVAARGQEATRAIWVAAVQLTDAQIAESRENARRRIADAQQGLIEAEQALGRVEGERDHAAVLIAERDETIATMQRELAEKDAAISAALARADELARRLDDQQRELSEARATVVASARLEGELAALRRQLDEQRQIIERVSTARGVKG